MAPAEGLAAKPPIQLYDVKGNVQHCNAIYLATVTGSKVKEVRYRHPIDGTIGSRVMTDYMLTISRAILVRDPDLPTAPGEVTVVSRLGGTLPGAEEGVGVTTHSPSIRVGFEYLIVVSDYDGIMLPATALQLAVANTGESLLLGPRARVVTGFADGELQVSSARLRDGLLHDDHGEPVAGDRLFPEASALILEFEGLVQDWLMGPAD